MADAGRTAATSLLSPPAPWSLHRAPDRAAAWDGIGFVIRAAAAGWFEVHFIADIPGLRPQSEIC